MERVLKSTEELDGFAKEFVDFAKRNHKEDEALFVRLSGDLGAGKTTFVKTVARIFGVSEQVTSPTFVLQKFYKTTDSIFHTLVHIDAYRIESEKEAQIFKLDIIKENLNTIIFVEWPERIETSLPKSGIEICIEHIDPFTRKFILKTYGEK